MRTPAELTQAFRARGWKITPQRQLLFRLLHGNDGHPSAEVLYALAHEQMPGISRRTVYQTLSELSAIGELRPINLGGATRFDPNTDHHHHAQCTVCGSLVDVYVEQVDSLQVHGLDGFAMSGATILFSGQCASCAAAAPPDDLSTPTSKEQLP